MRTRTTAVLLAALVAAATTTAADARDRGRAPATVKRAQTIPRGHSVIALARTSATPVFATRGARRPIRRLGRGVYGSRRVFLVDWPRARWTWPRWVRVHLPGKPNGSRGWVRARDVRFQLDSYRIDVNLTRRVLTVHRSARAVMRTPIGVGRAVWPTPTGRYYLTELIKTTDPDGAYGPYAFGTSAYSTVLTRFGRGGGQVGIHGTNQPWLIGKSISHGCIRLDNESIVRLAKTVPLGTPVRIFHERRTGRGHVLPRSAHNPKSAQGATRASRPRPAARRPGGARVSRVAAVALLHVVGLRPAAFALALARLLDLGEVTTLWRTVAAHRLE